MRYIIQKELSRLILFVAMLLVPILGYGQRIIKKYVKENEAAINSVDPDSSNYDDLEPIGKAIGDSRIVMLGEQDHGDAATFLAKSRLVKYLHEKKGFDVLAFESDFLGLNEGWDNLAKTDTDIKDFLRKNIFGVWSTCDACNTLFYHYIPETYHTSEPLIISGFDNQQYLNYSFHRLPEKLDSVMQKLKLPITKDPVYKTDVLALIDSSKFWDFRIPKDTIKISTCLRHLHQIEQQLSAAPGDHIFWKLVVMSIIAHAETTKNLVVNGKYSGDDRDVQMAKNLEWLINEKFKGKKIIVWAASAHISRSLSALKSTYYKDVNTMGAELALMMKDDKAIYTLGFTSSQGSSGRVGTKPYKIDPPRANSFESWLNPVNKYSFVDLRKFNQLFPDQHEDFFMSPFGHSTAFGKWSELFDGIFFIREMFPCKPDK